MALRAIKPEKVKESKPKFLISGQSGSGKTWFALDFPSVYFIDSEGGATRKQYREKMLKNKSAYFGKENGAQDFNSVIAEIKELATTKHNYKTLVIDSFSYLYNLAAALAEEKVGNDFGRDKKEANRPTRQLMRWIESLDMTVILICHYKEKWKREGKEVISIGSTFDGYDKLEYNLDLWIEIQLRGLERFFIVKKSRILTLPKDDMFSLSYQKFSELYGKDIIEEESVPIIMATKEQVQRLKTLVETVKIGDEEIQKWLSRAECESFEEFTEDQIKKCISYMQKKLDQLNNGNTNGKECKE